MLTAVPDYIPESPRVQVLGRVAVHHGDAESHRLTGSGQRLLAVLVAAGRDGATSERIADEIWGDAQPDPWRPALRMAVTRLRKQLPDGWDVVADGGFYRITTGDGWVDAWRLEAIAASDAPIEEDDLAWMLAGRPFGDIDLLEMVGSSTQNLQILQLAVAERFCSQEPPSMAMATCSALTMLVRHHPYNDGLALAVSVAMAGCGWRTEALLALTSFAETYADEIGDVPADIADFLSSGGHEGDDQRSRAADFLVPADAPELAKELRQLVDSPVLGRSAELHTMRQSTRGVLLAGARGAGKSRLLAELILVDASAATTYIVGDDQLDLPLGPFAVAMPELRDDLLVQVHDDVLGADDVSAAASRAWRIVLAYLENRSTKQRQRLIVDDAHLLDPASLGLLRLLIRSNTTSGVTLIVAGRNDVDDPQWISLMRDAGRAGLELVELGGLGLDELEMMVLQQFPEATSQSRHGLAVEVHDASGGLPAVAVPLIEAADPVNLALPEQLVGASALAGLSSTLSEQAPDVVAAAAVLGHEFSIGALIALTDLDEATIFSLLDELWSSRLILETDDPDRVRFRHVLVQRAFLDTIPMFRRSQLHRRAAELTDDPHLIASHQVHASALVDSEVTAASLRASAEIYAARRQWRNVARELQRLADLPGDHLDSFCHTLWAAALDQSGSDGSTHRRAGYSMAVEDNDWNGALDAALSGLPEAERPDGDQERIDMLEGIAAEDLSQERRFDLTVNLSRQYSLLGQADQVLEHTRQALTYASNPSQEGESHIMRWMATRHIEPVAHPIPDNLDKNASPHLLMRLAQINALNLAESGDFERSRLESERFETLAQQFGDPLRIWQAKGLRSMFLLNDGDFTGAEKLAFENFEFAQVHKLQTGAISYLGQRVFLRDCQSRLPDLGKELENFRSDADRMLVGRAAFAVYGDSVGKDVASDVRDLMEELRAGTVTTLSLLTTVLIARLVVRDAPEFTDQTRALLQRFGDNPLLTSVGGVNFGPTSRYVAQLTVDQAEKEALIIQAVAAADRQGPLLWRVLTRLDHAEQGSDVLLAEARGIAQGTDLEEVVEYRAARLP